VADFRPSSGPFAEGPERARKPATCWLRRQDSKAEGRKAKLSKYLNMLTTLLAPNTGTHSPFLTAQKSINGGHALPADRPPPSAKSPTRFGGRGRRAGSKFFVVARHQAALGLPYSMRRHARAMYVIPPKADIHQRGLHVRLCARNRHALLAFELPQSEPIRSKVMRSLDAFDRD
jgi:hypothetical protein